MAVNSMKLKSYLSGQKMFKIYFHNTSYFCGFECIRRFRIWGKCSRSQKYVPQNEAFCPPLKTANLYEV